MTAAMTAPHRTTTVDLATTDGATTIAGLPGHFCLHYQPQLDLVSGAILRCEALLRWWHPDFGLLSPYVSLCGTRWADDVSGLEGWAVAEACRQGARWHHQGLPVQIALNVSAPYLLRPGFVASVRHELDRSGLNPYLLAIDVPVHAVATDARRVERVTGALDDLGVGIVADGVAGAMATDRLGAIAAEAWKIDLGGRIEGTGGPAIHPSVGRAVERAHDRGARAVAKAVEDDAQLIAVRDLGFDEVFGNVVSPPLPGRAARDEFRAAPPRLRPLFGPLDRRELPDQAVRNR